VKPVKDVLKDDMWWGKPVFVVGGGPSIKGFDFTRLSGVPTIGCNIAFRWNPTIALCQDVRFFKQYKDDPEYLACESIKIYFKGHPNRESIHASDEIYIIESNGQDWSYSLDRGLVYGANVGLAAVNLADILGASVIYLLGFDASLGPNHETHYHDEYPANWKFKDVKDAEIIYKRWSNAFDQYKDHIEATVVNCSMDSKITAFPKKEFML
jgi:hypothetical protein